MVVSLARYPIEPTSLLLKLPHGCVSMSRVTLQKYILTDKQLASKSAEEMKRLLAKMEKLQKEVENLKRQGQYEQVNFFGGTYDSCNLCELVCVPFVAVK